MSKINREELFALHKQICGECLAVMENKNRDYAGHRADADPFSNFRDSGTLLNIHPAKGLLLRVVDKFKRITSFIDAGKLAVADEPVQDALKDIINYMVLLYGMIEDEKRTQCNIPLVPPGTIVDVHLGESVAEAYGRTAKMLMDAKVSNDQPPF